jgi:hypothetical protein
MKLKYESFSISIHLRKPVDLLESFMPSSSSSESELNTPKLF